MMDISLKIALGFFLLGTLVRAASWFRNKTGTIDPMFASADNRAPESDPFSRGQSFGRRLTNLLLFGADIFLQRPLWRVAKHRWLAHICIFYGFVLLLCMHALDQAIAVRLFPEFVSTRNPFLFLRNFFSAMVLFGIVVMIFSRWRRRPNYAGTHRQDIIALFFLGAILISGHLLEAVQIFSEPIFDEMVIDYLGSDDPDEIIPLKAYWAEYYSVVFSETPPTDHMKNGRALHQEFCMSCHSRPENAFISFSAARSLRSAAPWLNRMRADDILWYFHFLTCFAALACLPFSKFFHIFTMPLNWLLNALFPRIPSDARQVRAHRLKIGMDACTHCGICSSHCSVAPIFQISGNPYILPSEKLIGIRKINSSPNPDPGLLHAFTEGNSTCTGCFRCTSFCPAGIQLQDLWESSRNVLREKGYSDLHQQMHSRSSYEWSLRFEQRPESQTTPDRLTPFRHTIASPEVYTDCVQCSICSNVCPVATAGDGLSAPDTSPQQVMNLLRLNLTSLALGARMVWDCTTCYLCQEHCPQSIRVADILYELRNIAARRLNDPEKLPPELSRTRSSEAEEANEDDLLDKRKTAA